MLVCFLLQTYSQLIIDPEQASVACACAWWEKYHGWFGNMTAISTGSVKWTCICLFLSISLTLRPAVVPEQLNFGSAMTEVGGACDERGVALGLCEGREGGSGGVRVDGESRMR